MISLKCNGKIRIVRDIVISMGDICCSLVNDGHDDLIDLGFTVDELENCDLVIKSEVTGD